MVRLTGNMATNAGVAICGGTAIYFPTSVTATESTSAGCGTADTTSSTGVFSCTSLAANKYDIRVNCGSAYRWFRYADEIQHATYQTGDGCASGTEGNFYFGVGNDVGMRWSTADSSNHAFVVGIGDTSQQMHITDLGAIATDWARSAGTHPELAIHSNTTPATDYLAIGNHNGTTASIDVVGGTTLALAIAGNTELNVTASGLCVPACSDITFSGGTGTNDIVLANGLADALSITDGSADIVVVNTSGGTNAVTITGALTASLDITSCATVNASGDTAAGDNATMGYTSGEGLILTGQGSTNDVTIKNDADGDVISIPTGATNVILAGDLRVDGGCIGLCGDTNLLGLAANLLTVRGDLLITGQSDLRLQESGSGCSYVALQAPACLSANYTLTFPADDGCACEVLTTNGSGVLSWASAASGVSLSGSTNNTVATVTGSNALAGEANLLFDGNMLFLNECANTNMTIGITINQAGNDNQALAFKSSDVAHPMTAHVEADTWFAIRRGSDPSGGAYIEGFKDADAEPGHALMLEGTLGEAAHTVDSSAGRGVIEIDARITNGSTGRAAVGSGGNLLAIQTNDTTVAITKGNGDLHLTNTCLTALDDYPDALMARVARVEFSPPCSPIRERHGHLIEQYPELVEVVRARRILMHEPCDPGPGFINVQKSIALAWDMGFQNWENLNRLHDRLVEVVASQDARLATLEQHKLQDTSC